MRNEQQQLLFTLPMHLETKLGQAAQQIDLAQPEHSSAAVFALLEVIAQIVLYWRNEEYGENERQELTAAWEKTVLKTDFGSALRYLKSDEFIQLVGREDATAFRKNFQIDGVDNIFKGFYAGEQAFYVILLKNQSLAGFIHEATHLVEMVFGFIPNEDTTTKALLQMALTKDWLTEYVEISIAAAAVMWLLLVVTGNTFEISTLAFIASPTLAGLARLLPKLLTYQKLYLAYLDLPHEQSARRLAYPFTTESLAQKGRVD